MKIFSQIIATGKEWKPCIECGRVFVYGEIISSISTDSGFSVTYWYCCECIERFSLPNLYIDPEYICHRVDRLIELEKPNNYKRYIPYNSIERCSQN